MSEPHIRPFDSADADALIDLSLRAWAPVFESMERAMGAEIFRRVHPDWRVSQRKTVADALGADRIRVWVAEAASAVAGFVAVELHRDTRIGEVYLLAVDPDHQHRGIGTVLTEFALGWIKDAGMAVAMVGTGGDPGHAPARRTYEKVGFSGVPVVKYFKNL
jgi:GNAT superfamily N-acetyltransferase